MVTIRHERPTDIAAREALLDQCFGSARFAKTSRAAARRPPAGRGPVPRRHRRAAASSARCGCGTSAPVTAGRALLLGPLAVDSACRNRGIGAALMARAIARGAPARPSADPAGRRRALLRALRLLGRRHRRPVPARAVRAAPAARAVAGGSDGRRRQASSAPPGFRRRGPPGPRGDVPVRRRKARLSHAA